MWMRDFNSIKPLFTTGKQAMRLPTVVVRGDVLASWLTVSDYTKSRLAMELGVSKGRVSQLLTSQEEPSAHLIAKLMLVTNLPFDRLFKVVNQSSSLSTTRLSAHRVMPIPELAGSGRALDPHE
jgi:transcriptional regulator with XRE-family HTH domain